MPLNAIFFVIGPLRTGSSLMARCIDDHEDAICLCESEINRALFPDYLIALHAQRMAGHGFTDGQIFSLLDKKKQDRVEDLLAWYREAKPAARTLYGKPNAVMFGDKSPDFFKSPQLVAALADGFRLIYTIRDPRAVLRSIERQTDASRAEKEVRWSEFLGNIAAWRPRLGQPNVLVSKYEDLVRAPLAAMGAVYAHLGLEPSTRFMAPFERLHPRRFLWTTAVDWENGVRKDFDAARAEVREDELTPEQKEKIYGDPAVVQFMQRFGYLG